MRRFWRPFPTAAGAMNRRPNGSERLSELESRLYLLLVGNVCGRKGNSAELPGNLSTR